MKTRFIRALILSLCILVGMGTCGGALAQDSADLYFENGVIYTADEAGSIAEALAVKDGVIVYVGDAAGGEAYKGDDTEVVDLQGAMLLPGFIDAHIHSITMEFFDIVLLGLTDADEIMQVIAQYVAENPDQETYMGFGYLTNAFTGEELRKGPRKERLDEICPDKPMVIYSFDGHAAWANSAMLALSDITEETLPPMGGSIEKDEETGALWGTLNDAAMSLVPDMTDPEKVLPALADFQWVLNSLGYTGIMTLSGNGYFPVPLEGYSALEEMGMLSLRVRTAGIVTNWNADGDIAVLAEQKKEYNSDLLKATTAKFFLDGVMDNQSALLLEPYEGSEDHYGQPGWPADELADAFAKLKEAGIHIHAHSIGDGATRMALDAMEAAQLPADMRKAITHLQLVSPDDIPRFAELGVVAVAQPYWHFREPGYWEEVEYAVLGERAREEYPMQSFINAGVHLAASSDYPVTDVPNAFVAIELGVTRNLPYGVEEAGIDDITDMDDPACLLWPEERVTVEDMIRAFTIEGAYSISEEETTGSLEVGKSADLVIIDQDLFSINPLDISDTQVLRTYFMGTLVYDVDEE